MQNNQHIPGMAELEAKQEEILKQLAELKDQILSIKSTLNLNVVAAQKSTKPICTDKVWKSNKPQSSLFKDINFQIPNLPNIVVNINPNYPPYSLVIIQRLLQDVATLKISSHLHSTVSTLPDNTKNLENELVNFKAQKNVPEIHIRLIWKSSKYFRLW